MFSVVFDGELNCQKFFECHLGVKQGCLLSPLIFSLLISEVASKLPLEKMGNMVFN